jgi:hypothetical protein
VNVPAIVPRRIRILQQWEGVVSDVGTRDFTADLNSLTDPKAPGLTGEISLEEVSDSDRTLVEQGAVFYWVIGYDKSPTGQVTRISEIRFRRSPEWTRRKLDTLRSEAEQWFRKVLDDERK